MKCRSVMGSCRGHRPGAGDTAGEEGEGGTEGGTEGDIEVQMWYIVGDIEVQVWDIVVDIEVDIEVEAGDTRSSALAAPRRQDLAIMRGVV